MTQKEIKEKMTNGTWETSANLKNVGIPGTDCIEISSSKESWWIAYVQNDEYSGSSGNYDAAAIISAINNTYAKSINPESVSEMYNALRMLRGYLTEKADKEVLDNISEIIKNATL